MILLIIYSVVMMLFSIFLFSCSLMFYYLSHSIYFLWEIFFYNSMSFEFVVYLDWMSLLFMSLVCFISSLVLFYSVEYMSDDLNINRFCLLMLMFILSMLMMISCFNVISILVGWDGLGLVSFCLVIYYQNYKSLNSGMLTVLSNRVGDVGLLMLIAYMSMVGSWNLFFYLLTDKFIIMMLILLAITKSAQFPFSIWLPAAMAAPTPVSSLVHSSTLVTAGIYLLMRYFFLIKGSSYDNILFWLGSVTMFMAGMNAMFEYDLKKIIALSTLSQLGLMVGILSIGYEKIAFFHLIIHALFKSMLFLCAGLIIHGSSNNQDIRKFGALSETLPLVSVVFHFGNLSLCGFPFMAGFYSKDYIMELFFFMHINVFPCILFMISTVLTVSYSVRLSAFLFLGQKKYNSVVSLKDSYWVFYSIFMLFLFSCFGGSMMMWMFFYNEVIILSLPMKLMVLGLCFLGLYLGTEYMFMENKNFFLWFMNSSMWFLNNLFSNIYSGLLILSKKLYIFIDKAWLEFWGPKMINFYMLWKLTLLFMTTINLFKLFKFFVVVMIFFYMYF